MRALDVAAAVLLGLGLSPPVLADSGEIGPPDPGQVARRVDALIAADLAKAGAELAPRCDDATFLRRVWLDVVGDIPAPEHVVAFLLDKSYDKRGRVVDELLADPQYGVNWARYWRDVVFSRRVEDRALAAANAMEADLGDDLNSDRGWDQIAADFITAKGDVRERGATAIVIAQDGRTEETTAEVARIFLGIQIQCAQCHDHPYDSWKREQFHELAAFFPRVGVRPVLSPTRRSFEVIANDRPFAPRRRGNNAERLPTPEHLMPDLERPTAPGTRMTPKFFLTGAQLPLGSTDEDRRQTLAAWITANEWFAKAAVNRMWAELVGAGFYEPVDDLGPEREPRSPEALAVLAEGFAASGFDLKWLLTTIAATEAYQRESRPRSETESAPFAANVPQPLRSDQLYNAMLSALDANEEPAGRLQRGGPARNGRGGRRGDFEEVFGFDPSLPRDTVGGSIPQALAMMNSPQIAQALRAKEGSRLGTLAEEIADDRQLVVELYLRTLNRQPTARELSHHAKYLGDARQRRTSVEDLAWALVNCAEFRYRK